MLAAPLPRPPKIPWPPSPSVEDEVTSLSREHSPSLPELDPSEAKVRGSVDQQPVLMEVGKEEGVRAAESQPAKPGKKKGVRFHGDSSDESSGPPTPTEASPEHHDRFQRPRSQSKLDDREHLSERRQNTPLASPSIQDVLANSVRPRRAAWQAHRVREEDRKANTDKVGSSTRREPYAPPPDVSKHPHNQDYFGHQEPRYPGTLEELKVRRRGERHPPYLPFAERHRTMSGSSGSADHRPQNMRHMSAMGYCGESKTPSFARDHPSQLHSPLPPTPGTAPAFRKPAPKDHAVETNSEPDVSPDESPRREKRSPRNISELDGIDASGQGPSQDYPVRQVRGQRKQHERPTNPLEQRWEPALRPLPEPLKSQDCHDLPVKSVSSRPAAVGSQSGSPRTSDHGTPPSSPQPSSKDGLYSKEHSPSVAKNHHLPASSFIASAIPFYPIVSHLKCTDDHQPQSNLHRSRPSPPVMHPSSDVSTERQSRDTSRRTDPPPYRQSASPLPAPAPSRALKQDLRVDVHGHTLETPMKTWHGTRPDMRGRPLGGDLSAQHLPYSQQPPTSVPFRNADQHIRNQKHDQHHASPQSARLPLSQTRFKPRDPPTSLPPCPRPGFVTGHNDWWTLRNAPDLDICPSCKEALEAGGSTASFVPSPPRSTTYQTRCDLSIPWVRMAWLLVLQGKASKTLIRDVIVSIAHESPCPGRNLAVRPWRRIYDEEHGRLVPNFDACPSCVRSVETLFPNLKGHFEAVPYADPKKRSCDLTFESPRFTRYVDLLDEISSQALKHHREPNMLRFVSLARSYADIQPCHRDDQFRGVPWYFIPHLPDFTVCEECYVNTVWPAVIRGSDIAKSFNGNSQLPPAGRDNEKMSCQLYSARMRSVFERACDRNDFQGLRREALARVGKERELQKKVDELQRVPVHRRAEEMEALVGEWRRWE
ncbi:MAG: hypothetical protein LQ340_003230 [Diploschistes diacapsis]|nr:MAG: hypothetical protein LQ340_003230 [Diploschistes diacapsis]